MKNNMNKLCFCAFIGLFTMLSTGCTTGIEGTRTIKMSRSDKRDTQPGAEQAFISTLRSEPLEEWQPGKPFLISDNKAAIIFEISSKVNVNSDSVNLTGKTIRFAGISERPTPGGDNVAVIEFHDADGAYLYNTSRKPEEALTHINGLNIPMVIDLDLVTKADSLMHGKQVWTRSRLWYDSNGNLKDGKKYVPVRIDRVLPGNMIFPLRVEFTDTAGRSAHVLMNVAAQASNHSESRTFPTIFSLSDPKLKYPQITPSNWELICNGKVAYGMTKDECRLSLGSPADVDSGYNWDYFVDVWSYKDGTYLQFKDGLLVGYRK